MAKDIPDYMRGFDLEEDWGATAVSSAPKVETRPTIDKKDIENLGEKTNLEIAKVKNDVGSIKAMMNEIMQIVAEKDTITKEVNSADVDKRFKDIEKIVLPFCITQVKQTNLIYIGLIEDQSLRHRQRSY